MTQTLKQWLKQWEQSPLLNDYSYAFKHDITITDADKDAAWEMYIELATRITTQPLPDNHGEEKAALTSLYSLFGSSREIMKRHGRGCADFTGITLPVINMQVRPFTAKWHKLSEAGAFDDPEKCQEFRKELKVLQKELGIYSIMMSGMAMVK